MILIFPTHPDKVQNGSARKVKGDIEDIIIQGYRRSLSDWLIICHKTVADYRNLRDEGYSVKRAIVHGVPRLRSREVSRDITFAELDARNLPPNLTKLKLRRARIEAWFAKFNKELDDSQRSFLSYRLLTECYEAWRHNKPWKPTYATLFPHCEVIKPTSHELHLAASISRCKLLERLPQGYYPTPRLEAYFSPAIKKQQKGLIVWYPLLCSILLPDETLLTMYRISFLIKIHRAIMLRAWQAKGIHVKTPKPLSEWKALAKVVDSKVSSKFTKGLAFRGRKT